MIIRGYLNRYKEYDVIHAVDTSAVFIPLANNKALVEGLDDVEKLITYETINGMNVRNVYINNHRDFNTPYIHIYTVMLPRSGIPIALVNVHGVELLTGKHAVTLADRVYNRICTHAIENDGDPDYIQLLALSSRDTTSDTEDYLTNLDDRNYDRFLTALYGYMDNCKDLLYLYKDYINQVGFISKGAFFNLPSNIDEVMGMVNVIMESNELTDLLIKTTVSGVEVPAEYQKYDHKTRRLVENGYLTKEDTIRSFCVDCKSIKTDKYVPVLKFGKYLTHFCYSLIETNQVENERIYILSECKEVQMQAVAEELLDNLDIAYPGITRPTPGILIVRRTIAEEVFIDVLCKKEDPESSPVNNACFFIDLTLIPLICHGLRYVLNEELS